jgi:precorrin-6x reductase
MKRNNVMTIQDLDQLVYKACRKILNKTGAKTLNEVVQISDLRAKCEREVNFVLSAVECDVDLDENYRRASREWEGVIE